MTKKLKLSIAFLSLLVIALTCFITYIATASSGADYTFDAITTLKQTYNVGEDFSVPDVKMRKGDQVFDTQSVVIFPDGSAVTNKTVNLSQSGEYKLTFTGNDVANSVTRSISANFSVANALYKITGSNASATPKYVTNDEYGLNGTSGVFAQIMNGDTLYFNKVIDISGYESTDKIITFFNVPNTVGSHDGNITVRLTDATDPNNYVDVDFKKYGEDSETAERHTYISASFNGGDTKGLGFYKGEDVDDNSVYYNGAFHQLYVNNEFGASVVYSLIGKPENTDKKLGEELLSVSYDQQEKAIYANGEFVIDLDNPLFFPNGFKGFATNEVFVSIYGKSYTMDTINPYVIQLAQCNLSKNTLIYVEKPEISVDLCGFSENDVKGVVDKAFKLFDAVANDKLSGKVQVKASVYKNYYNKNKVYVSVTDNGFLPKSAGNYYIEYVAKDFSGNTAKKVIKVSVAPRTNPLTAIVNSPTYIATVGKTVKAFDDVTVQNYYGNYTVNAVAVAPNGTEYELDANNNFFPETSGDYTIKVTVNDYIESQVKEFKLTVNANDGLEFLGVPITENYFIKGAKYNLFGFDATKFSDVAPEQIKTDIYVNEDDAGFVKLDGETYTVSASSTVQIRYTANNGVRDYHYTCAKVPVVDVDYNNASGVPKLEKYFYTNDFTVTNTLEYVDFSANGSTAIDGTIDYVNKVQVERFALKLGFKSSEKNFSKVSIYLIDAFNAENQIKLSYTIKNGMAYYEINDSANYLMLSSSFENSDCEYTLSYNNASRTFFAEINNGAVVKTNLNGQPFNGFEKSTAFVKIVVEDAFASGLGVAGLKIYNLNLQAFNSNTQYVTINDPQIIHVSNKGEVALNDTFTVNKFIVMDVLDPYVKVTEFFVKDADGNVLTSVDGVKLDGSADVGVNYVVKATKYGNIRISLTVENGVGYKEKISEKLNVVDIIPPVITLEMENVQTTAKIGDVVTLAKATVSDDNSAVEAIKLSTLVQKPNGVTKPCADDTITIDMKGEYRIGYIAYDENGNMAHVSYKIVVA